MLVNLQYVLDIAQKEKFALPAFNVYNMETVMGIFEAAEELHAPIVVQSYSRLFTNKEAYFLAPIVLAAAKKASVPVCFHLDHGAGYEEVAKAVRYGATGIMFDGSSYDFEKNVAMTKKVCDLCAALNIPVEGELGHVGSANDDSMGELTKVSEAVEFVKQTKVASLAVQVGTAHGRYKKEPKLAIDRIEEIKDAVQIPLVLHGGSGIPDEQIVASIKAGIRKVNFGTDVCYSFLDQVFATPRDKVAIDMFMKDSIESVKNFAMGKIKLLGAENKA